MMLVLKSQAKTTTCDGDDNKNVDTNKNIKQHCTKKLVILFVTC